MASWGHRGDRGGMRRAAIVHFFVETTGYMLGSFRKNPLPMGFPRLATLISLCRISSSR